MVALIFYVYICIYVERDTERERERERERARKRKRERGIAVLWREDSEASVGITGFRASTARPASGCPTKGG